MKTNRKLFALLAIVILLLSACAEEPTPTPEPAEDPTEAPAEDPTEAPAEEPAEAPAEEPAEEPTEEAMAGPIFIGGIHPLTGGLAADGIQMDNAIQMAIDELNEAGGALDGLEFAYLGADSTGAAEVGQTEAERLIGEGAVALICCFQSAVTSNVAAIAERDGVPLVIDVAVADAILDQGYAYTFRLQPNATSMGVNGARFLHELGENSGEVRKLTASFTCLREQRALVTVSGLLLWKKQRIWALKYWMRLDTRPLRSPT